MKRSGWLIIGHYGGHNTGDEAMLAGLLSALPASSRQRATVARQGGKQIPGYPDVEVIPTSLKPVLGRIRSSEGVVLGGGTHFHDDYRGTRLLRHYRYLIRFVMLGLVIRLLHRRWVWLGIGIGPCRKRFTRLLTRIALWTCTSVSARDKRTQRTLEELGYSDSVLSFDLAALLLPIFEVNHIRDTSANRPRFLGISLTSVRSTATGGPDVDQSFVTMFEERLVDLYLRERDLHLIIFEMRGGSRESDTSISEALHRKLTALDSSRSSIFSYEDDPLQMLIGISMCDALIATRYHAGLLGYLSGARVMLLAYHEKLHALAEEIGLAPAAVLPLAQSRPADFSDRLSALAAGDRAFNASLPRQEALARARINIEILQSIA
jgi:polysaccharide pyruvyl transferase WcaK-like protein